MCLVLKFAAVLHHRSEVSMSAVNEHQRCVVGVLLQAGVRISGRRLIQPPRWPPQVAFPEIASIRLRRSFTLVAVDQVILEARTLASAVHRFVSWFAGGRWCWQRDRRSLFVEQRADCQRSKGGDSTKTEPGASGGRTDDAHVASSSSMRVNGNLSAWPLMRSPKNLPFDSAPWNSAKTSGGTFE